MGRILGSIPVDGFITPRDSDNLYATHIAEYGKGGFHSVETIEDRDNISMERLTVGMGAYVQEKGAIYMLKSFDPEGTDRVWGSFFEGSGVIPDWNEADAGSLGYVANKPNIGTIDDFLNVLYPPEEEE